MPGPIEVISARRGGEIELGALRGTVYNLPSHLVFRRLSEPLALSASVDSSVSQSVMIARALTSGGYGGDVVSRVSSTGPPTVKW